MKTVNSGYLLLGVVLFSACQPVGDQTVATNDRLVMDYSDAGMGERALVLVHGWSNSRDIWVKQIPELAEKYRVIAPDLPGFGRSGFGRTSWTMQAFGDDILTLIEQLDLEEVVLVGFSMGAAPCVEAATAAPDLVKGLVIVDAIKDPGQVLPYEAIEQKIDFMMNVIARDGEDFSDQPNPFFQNNARDARDLVIRMLSTRKNKNRVGWRESLREVMHWENTRCRESLQQLNIPVMGIYSLFEPVNEEALKASVPEIELEYISNAGHAVMWDYPDKFNALLEKMTEKAFSD